MAPAANHAWYKSFFLWLHETAACCYFGVDLRKGLDEYSLSFLLDGTPHSSSGLLYFIPLLPPILLNKIILSPIPFLRFGQKFSESNFSSFFYSDKNILSPASFSQNHSKTIPNAVFAAKSFDSRKNLPSPIFFLT